MQRVPLGRLARADGQEVFATPRRIHFGAQRVYERAGFSVISSHVRKFERFGEVTFLTMVDPALPE